MPLLTACRADVCSDDVMMHAKPNLVGSYNPHLSVIGPDARASHAGYLADGTCKLDLPLLVASPLSEQLPGSPTTRSEDFL